MAEHFDRFEPGQRVVVMQQIPQREQVWTTRIEGTVQRYEQRKTGSWFAHAKDDKLWLDRLTLQKDDGEIIVCVLDNYSHVEVLPQPAQQQPALAEAQAATPAPDAQPVAPVEEGQPQ